MVPIDNRSTLFPDSTFGIFFYIYIKFRDFIANTPTSEDGRQCKTGESFEFYVYVQPILKQIVDPILLAHVKRYLDY